MNYKHGQARKGQKTPEYRVWTDMKKRCLNPNYIGYKNYGGRGIKICDRWLNFENFFEDMGNKPEGLMLERMDNDGNYESGNCKWATRKEQNNNKRDYKERIMGKVQYWFYGHSLNEELIIENNMHKMARYFELDPRHISDCLNGKRKTHKGWSFGKMSDWYNAINKGAPAMALIQEQL